MKYITILFLLGVIISLLGRIGKVNSEPWGNSLLTVGLYTMIIAIAIYIIKLLREK
jgi:hypothetical protein